MAQVFLSYQKDDRVLAEKVGRSLRNAGFSVWWDQDVHPGDTWDRLLERELEAARCILVLWTPRSVESSWVRMEAHYAAHDCKPSKLIHVRFDDCTIPFAFRLIQYLDLDPRNPERSRAWETLVKWVIDKAGQPERPAGSDIEPEPKPVFPIEAMPDTFVQDRTIPSSPSGASNLPLFYTDLVPLQAGVHGDFRTRYSAKAPFFANAHAIPITIDEFIIAQRDHPIVFSSGDTPVPLALMGLNEGVNVFVDPSGALLSEVYVPAYVRRYPWLLARLHEGAEELSLCFDPASDTVGAYRDGERLFDGDRPSETTANILKFCEDFELSAQRTAAFVQELKDIDLLMEGEVSIQLEERQQPYVYRGFIMVNEEKFQRLGGRDRDRLFANGMLPLITAHLSSLSLMSDLFGRQMRQGKVPPQA